MCKQKLANSILLAVAIVYRAAQAQTANLDEVFAKAAKWDFDQDREPVRAVADLVVKAKGDPGQLREIERHLIVWLKSGTPGGKDFACKELSVMGSDVSVPALAGMLLDPGTSNMARYALERIPGAAANRALGEALARSSDKIRIGIVNSLGVRRDPASVVWLRPLAMGTDAASASAALFALGAIADRSAVQALAEAQGKNPAAAEAYLKAADRLVEVGSKADALPIYQKLYAAGSPPIIRVGALRGIAMAGGKQSIPELLQALRGDDARLQAVAVRSLAQLSIEDLSVEMPRVSESAQIRILAALAEREDRSALPVFKAAINSTNSPVRLAALETVGRVGDASVVPLLAKFAGSDDEAAKVAAHASLVRIHGADVDSAIVNALASAEPKVKIEIARVAGERGGRTAAPALVKLAQDADAGVRRAALRALRDTASDGEITGLVGVTVKPADPTDRTEAVRSLAAVLRRSDPSRIQEVISAYKSASDLETRAGLMDAMGQSGNPQALDTLHAALQDPNTEAKRAAILAVTAWPNDVPAADLVETARTATFPAHQVLALRGAIRLIGQPGSSRAPRETVRLLTTIMSLAKQPEEKRAVLALLPRFPVLEALELAKASLGSDVGAEAKQAADRLQRQLR
jgi:HEAT repeat protein